ncbi:MAG: hypothetical protein JWN40_5870 [Phycisphaerales bacterium]|jgi:hypothetical protein|nr:hypothetical protein [Phycisphaerales bacterium]
MITDDKERHVKLMMFGGLVALSLGLGYSMGLNHKLDSPANQIKLGPTDPESIVLLQKAGQRARAAGDAKTAEWLDQACSESSERLFAWATAKAHGQQVHAGAK